MATRALKTVENIIDELDTPKGAHRKLMAARRRFHSLELKKTGKNTFAGYSYFELGDFLIPALQVFGEVGLCATISFTNDLATMTITDLDNIEDRIVLTSPMGSAALKGCHEVQNIGAVETYQRRYLWVAALEIVEHDALDATTGRTPPEPRSEFITDQQRDDLDALAGEVGADIPRFCKYFGVKTLSCIPAERYAAAVEALKAKKKESA